MSISDESIDSWESHLSEKGSQMKKSIEEAIKSGDINEVRRSASEMMNEIFSMGYGRQAKPSIEVNESQAQDMLDFGNRTEGLLFPPGTEGQRIFFKISTRKDTYGKKVMFYPKPSSDFGVETWKVYMSMFGVDEVVLQLE